MVEHCIRLLKSRGVEVVDIAKCTKLLQDNYHPNLKLETCIDLVYSTLEKREVQNAIMTGIFLDEAIDKNLIQDEHLVQLVSSDAGLYGIDEVLAYGICNLYGSIALTNFGYIDKCKPLIVGELNDDHERCNTFLDDIVGAIAASAASKLAHNGELYGY